MGEHDAGEAQDVHGVADLRIAAGEAEGRVGAVLHAQQGEVAAGVWRGAAGRCRVTAGALNFFTSASSFVPFESRTVSWGCGLSLALASPRPMACRRMRSSTSGRSPRMSPRAFSAGSTQACSMAFFFSSCVTHGGQAMHRIDHVGVGDEVAAAVDEPGRCRSR